MRLDIELGCSCAFNVGEAFYVRYTWYCRKTLRDGHSNSWPAIRASALTFHWRVAISPPIAMAQLAMASQPALLAAGFSCGQYLRCRLRDLGIRCPVADAVQRPVVPVMHLAFDP